LGQQADDRAREVEVSQPVLQQEGRCLPPEGGEERLGLACAKAHVGSGVVWICVKNTSPRVAFPPFLFVVGWRAL